MYDKVKSQMRIGEKRLKRMISERIPLIGYRYGSDTAGILDVRGKAELEKGDKKRDLA